MSEPVGYVIVREFGTDKEIDRVAVKGGAEWKVDRVHDGMMINLDTERFYLEAIYAGEKA